jgi:hypothetical protein
LVVIARRRNDIVVVIVIIIGIIVGSVGKGHVSTDHGGGGRRRRKSLLLVGARDRSGNSDNRRSHTCRGIQGRWSIDWSRHVCRRTGRRRRVDARHGSSSRSALHPKARQGAGHNEHDGRQESGRPVCKPEQAASHESDQQVAQPRAERLARVNGSASDQTRCCSCSCCCCWWSRMRRWTRTRTRSRHKGKRACP